MLSVGKFFPLQAAVSSRCQAVLRHALEAKSAKSEYVSRLLLHQEDGLRSKRQKTEENEEDPSQHNESGKQFV